MAAMTLWSVRIIGGLMVLTALWHLWLGLFGLAAYAITSPYAPTTNDTILPLGSGIFLALFALNWLTGWGVWMRWERARKAAVALHLWGFGVASVLAALNNWVMWRFVQMAVALWALWILTRPTVRSAFQGNNPSLLGQLLACGFVALSAVSASGLALGGTFGRWQARPEVRLAKGLALPWHTDFARAQREAQRSGKPILLVLVAGGDPQEPC